MHAFSVTMATIVFEEFVTENKESAGGRCITHRSGALLSQIIQPFHLMSITSP